jgi:hypothetical protein
VKARRNNWCARWVIKETQEADIIQSDNDSGAKTDRDKLDGNGERWSFEARSDRSPVAHSSQDPLNTTTASPNMLEFETYLENGFAPRQPLESVEILATGTGKKKSKNDEFWEGVLASEKARLQQLSGTTLTSVDAMMVGSSSDEDNTDTPLKRATKRRAEEKSSSTIPPDGASSGASPPSCIRKHRYITHSFHLQHSTRTTQTPLPREPPEGVRKQS